MKRTLTIHFHRAITDPKQETLEVVVTPLSSANHPQRDQTILGLKQTRKVTLREPVTVVSFELTPSYQIGLDQPILYRIAWRRGSFGRIESHEFAMPDQNVDFDDLLDLGHIITGENYLSRDDMGVPGGVARLDEDGNVIDANGQVILSGDTTDLWARLENEIAVRDSAITGLRSELLNRIDKDITQLGNAQDAKRGTLNTTLRDLISAEADTRSAEDQLIRGTLANVQSSVTQTATTLRAEFAAADTALGLTKADLVNGKIPASQMPDIALGTAVPVDSEADMLQLSPSQVQPGDLAVRPDGTFMLVAPSPGDINSWKRITSKNAVSSVNGETGAVTLTYEHVGARSATAKIPVEDLIGLGSLLDNKANKTAVDSANTQINIQKGRIDALTGVVNGMEGAWSQAVLDAGRYASDADDSAKAAAQSATNISDVEQNVNQTLLDVRGVRDNINITAGQVSDDASQVTQDRETTAELAAVATTAAYLLNKSFEDLGPIVNSVNSVLPDENGNVSIFGGGTTLMLTEDSENPGLYHVTGQ